jgi:CPA2 family monovalent cation:H+ antiporter-2
MPHEATLIATVAASLGLAMVLGFLATKVRMPPLVGYLVAGIVIGPHTRGFVADVALAGELAEIGVILLMFGVGLHFSLEDLAAVRRVAVLGAVLQMAAATALGALAAWTWNWSLGATIVFGLSISAGSTVVLLRSLEARGMVTSFDGRLAIAWLIVQDLVMVIVLVLLPAFAKGEGLALTLAITFGKIAAFVVLMFVVGRRVFPRVLWLVAKTGSRELFTLCVIAAAVGVAYGSAHLFGLSFALGAFFAGMMMRESSLSHRAATESLPLQDAFAVLFFVSVGMLFDPTVLARQPLEVLVTTAIVMVGTPVAAALIVRAFRYPLSTALTVGAGLAQIGEFAFILAGLGVSLHLLSDEARNLILAAALLSITLNPLVFALIAPLQRRAKAPRKADPLAELPATVDSAVLTGHVVIVGYGRVGRRIADALAERGVAQVVVEQSREKVERLRTRNVFSVTGDATDAAVLIQAHVARARMLVIAMPDTMHVRKIVEIARMLNPSIDVVVRTHSDEEAELLRQENVGEVFMGEHELALGMTRHVLARVGRAAEGG